MRTAFLDKTLLAVARAAEQSLFSEAYARKPGLLQSLDVRVKLFSFAYLIIVASLARTIWGLGILYGSSLILASLSGVPITTFLKRVWFFVPIFSAVIVIPALLNVITPGDPVLVLMKFGRTHSWGPYVLPREIAVTRQGLEGGIIFVARVATSVSFAVLFTVTTRWSAIFAGLRALSVPKVFVMTMSMTYRYLFLFLRLVQDLYRARKSRTIVPLSASGERGWVASRIGFLFGKSTEMSRDIYQAMISRGYHGEALTMSRFRSATRDYLWLLILLALGAIMLVSERGLFE